MEVGNQKRKGYQVIQNLTENSADIKSIFANCDIYAICFCNGTTSDNINSVRVQREKVKRENIIYTKLP